MACTLASRLLGILKARIIGAVFGASGVADVINFTFNIPNNFRKLFAEGALNGALVPYFSAAIETGDRKTANKLMGLLVTYQVILFVPLCICSYLYAEPLIDFFSDFGTGQVALGASLLPFFMVFLATISIGTTFNGILFCHKRFFHASFAPLLFSLSVIVGVGLFHDRFGAMSMAYATVTGGVLQGSYSYFAVRKLGYRATCAVKGAGTPIVPLAKAWLHVMAGSSFLVAGQLIAYWFASGLDRGTVTALGNAMIFWQTPYGIFFNAIVSVAFPLMSRSWAAGRPDEVKAEASKGMQYLATFLFPSLLLLFFLANECVSSVLQTGNYTLADSMLTARILRWYLVGMPIVAWYGLLQRVGYSLDRHRTVTGISLVQTLLDILVMWTGIRLGYGIVSLPVANALSFLVGLLALSVVTRDVYPLFGDRTLGKQLSKLLVANLPLLCIGLWYASRGSTWWQEGSTLQTLLSTVLLGLAGILVTFVSYRITRIPFLEVLRNRKKTDLG
jgi:putative peptidoglycan lipid II flippase